VPEIRSSLSQLRGEIKKGQNGEKRLPFRPRFSSENALAGCSDRRGRSTLIPRAKRQRRQQTASARSVFTFLCDTRAPRRASMTRLCFRARRCVSDMLKKYRENYRRNATEKERDGEAWAARRYSRRVKASDAQQSRGTNSLRTCAISFRNRRRCIIIDITCKAVRRVLMYTYADSLNIRI